MPLRLPDIQPVVACIVSGPVVLLRHVSCADQSVLLAFNNIQDQQRLFSVFPMRI
jgi:hypothetical protein